MNEDLKLFLIGAGVIGVGSFAIIRTRRALQSFFDSLVDGVRKVLGAVNPANPDNVVRSGINEFVEATTGQTDPIVKIDASLSKVFAAVDLINPFATAERKRFARKELGL